MGFGFSGIVKASFALKLEEKFGLSPWMFFLVTGGLTCLVTVITTRGKHWKVWPYFLCTLWGMYATWGYTLLEDVKTPKSVFANIEKENAFERSMKKMQLLNNIDGKNRNKP